MMLRLQCTITLLHPYNGHIPGIFSDVHVISISQHGCGTAQKGPQLQAALFVLIDEDRGAHWLLLVTMLVSPGLRVSSSSDPKIHEDGPSPRLLSASASLFLTSCLRAPSATGRRWCPQQLFLSASYNKKIISWCIPCSFRKKILSNWIFFIFTQFQPN